MDSARFVIVGAGLAGMATAYALTRRGETGVLILEKENLPGLHSSGRNAAMIRQVVPRRTYSKLPGRGRIFSTPRLKIGKSPFLLRKPGLSLWHWGRDG